MQEMADEEEKTREKVFSSEIKDIFATESKARGFVVKTHPEKAVENHVWNFLNNNILLHFMQTLQRRQKQITFSNAIGNLTLKLVLVPKEQKVKWCQI